MGFWTKIAGGVVLAAALSLPALAADPDVPARDPKGFYRYLTQEADSTTSTCIGDPKTPLCAVETVLACVARSDDDLCRRAAWPGFPDLRFSDGVRSPFDDKRYRVIHAKKITAATANKPRIGNIRSLAGDVIIALKRTNRAPGGWGREWPEPTIYLTRLYQGEWRVVMWDTVINGR